MASSSPAAGDFGGVRPPRAVFIGAGKAGCSVARYFAEGDVIELAGFCSRTATSARAACALAGGRVFPAPVAAAQQADVIFITTPDAAIATVWRELADAARMGALDLAGKTIAHCSGATPSSVFAGAADLGTRALSIHPLYAMSSRARSWQELGRCWFTLEGDPQACDAWSAALEGLGNRTAHIETAQKTRYHAAAAMASNLVVGLYDLAAEELARCGLSRADAEAAMAPLFLGNAEHIARDGVAASLTGPASRGDIATIDRHLKALGSDDDGSDAAAIYRALTKRLLALSGHGDVPL